MTDETGLRPYDLEPPARTLMPPLRPLLWGAIREERPRYVPGPLADGMMRMVLDDYGCTECGGEPRFHEYNPTSDTIATPGDIFDVPAEQVARWRAAEAAHDAALEEVDALIQARRDAAIQAHRA